MLFYPFETIIKFLKLCLVSLASMALVSGCASHRSRLSDDTYKLSQARIIGKNFHYGKLKDSIVPKEQYVANENFLYNLIGNTSALSVPNPGMGGVHGWSGFGVGLGLSLLQSYLAPTAYEMLPGAFGYVLAKNAKTREEARDYWINSMIASIKAANKRWNQGYKIEVIESDPFGDDVNAKIIYFINSEKGCPAYEEVKNVDKTCRMDLRTLPPIGDTPDVIPKELTGGKYVEGWKISNREFYDEHHGTTIYWTIARKSQFNRDEFYQYWMKTLKPYTYIYSETHRGEDGKRIPPYIIERNKVHFWVVPDKK